MEVSIRENDPKIEAPEGDVAALNRVLAQRSAPERTAWALERFGDRIVLSTSFGAQSAVMLHLVTRQAPDIPVIFIDTGYLFPETYRFAEQLTEQLKLNLKVFNPGMTAARQETLYGRLWEGTREDLVKYGMINKVEPMNRALQEHGAEAWLAGLRRSQATTRKDLDVVSRQNRTWKIHPLIDWSDRDVHRYLTANNLPYHPLWEKGYTSIGDWHSSRPLGEGISEEETRFNGIKRECGLHERSENIDFQI